ncbi:hypothetical protein [Mycolicibacterium poriferae]|uniref:hypothetical protein n=1 Tax=Mycolicibacterium poriferae TaxID=39694 RepID=UPI003D2F8DDF
MAISSVAGSPGAVGSAIRRVDGVEKITGTEAYGDDIAPPGTLALRVVRSPFPRAGFVLGDLDGFVRDTPGVVAVLSAADVPGRNCFGVIPDFADQPVFAEVETRFRGEAVAAVIGTPAARSTASSAARVVSTASRRAFQPIVPIRQTLPCRGPKEGPISMPKSSSIAVRAASPSTPSGMCTATTLVILCSTSPKTSRPRPRTPSSIAVPCSRCRSMLCSSPSSSSTCAQARAP